MSDIKKCTSCQCEKPLTDFYMTRSWKTGSPSEPKPMSICKDCHLKQCADRRRSKVS